MTPLGLVRPIELTDNRRSSLTRAIIGILMVVVGIAMVVFSIWRVQATNGGEDASSDQFTMILYFRSHRRRRTGVPRNGGHSGVLDAGPHEGR